MSNDELSTQDVLTDATKNLCTLYQHEDDDDETNTISLTDNQYFTETDFIEFLTNANISNRSNLTILSINIDTDFKLKGKNSCQHKIVTQDLNIVLNLKAWKVGNKVWIFKM